jgi:hypothetical protein
VRVERQYPWLKEVCGEIRRCPSPALPKGEGEIRY